MPRKRRATLERAEIAVEKLGAAVQRLPAAAWWLAALGSMRELRTLPPGSAAARETSMWAALAVAKTAIEVCRDPALDDYFRGKNRVAHVRHWLLEVGPTICGVPPASHAPTRPPLYVWARRGPLPGPKPQRQKHSDAWIAERAAWVRSEWTAGEPTDLDIALEIPVSYRTYQRWKLRSGDK